MDELDISLGLFLVIITIVALILCISVKNENDTLGQMICDEHNLGDYVSFDKSTKTIKCEPQENTIKYDGGYIKIVRSD